MKTSEAGTGLVGYWTGTGGGALGCAACAITPIAMRVRVCSTQAMRRLVQCGEFVTG
jgi:hypothetical protein